MENGRSPSYSGGNDLAEKTEKLQELLEEEKNRHLRTLADFDNFRKRVERDAAARSAEGKKSLILDLLPVLDNLQRAIDGVLEEQVRNGLRIVSLQFTDLLQKHGAVLIETIGKPFNPEEHEGVGFVESGSYPEGHVAEELSKGYRFGDSLLRAARVRVARSPGNVGNGETG
jgi:molecular chaperone GrpE